MGFFKKIKQYSEQLELTKRELERRYPLFPVQKEEEKIRRGFLNLSLENLKLMRKVAGRVQAMSYFDEIVISDIRVQEIKKAKIDEGKKVIGIFCNFVPEELIYAAGAIPVRLCAGFYDTISFAEEVLPRDICPLIKSCLGFKILKLPYFELCDLAVLPTTCDGKKKLGEILSDYLPTWMLELPQRKDHLRAREVWLGEVKVFKRKLEKLTGVKITEERLKRAIQLLHKRTEVFRQLFQIRKNNPPLISGRDSLLVIQTSFYDRIDRWIQKTKELYQELQEMVRQNPGIYDLKTPRLLLTGAPIIWPNYKLLNIVEELGAVIVIDELCSGTQHLYDSVEIDEETMDGMLRAVADRYLLPSTCPCFVESNDRIDKLFQMSRDFSVEGVIYHNLRLCQLYDLESGRIRQILKSKGIPTLNIQTDYSTEDVEQIKTRVEAFLEMIRSKRRKI